MRVERRVQARRIVLKMNQPCEMEVVSWTGWGEVGGEKKTYHQEEAEGVVEGVGACAAEGSDDVETAGGEGDADRDPEAAIGGERGSTESVANSHFPMPEA
jgi:hypothetical protein